MSEYIFLTPKLKVLIEEWRWGKNDASFLAMTDAEVIEAILEECRDISKAVFEIQNDCLKKSGELDAKSLELQRREAVLAAQEAMLDAITKAKFREERDKMMRDIGSLEYFGPYSPKKKENQSKNGEVKLIMGHNFFGPLEWVSHFGIYPIHIPDFPWSEELLQGPCPFNQNLKLKDTHFAFLGVGENCEEFNINATLAETLAGKFGAVKFDCMPDPWFKNQPFSQEALEYQWYLMPKFAVIKKDANYDDYQKFLASKGYRMAKGVEEVAKLALYCIASGQKLYQNLEALCSDKLENLIDRRLAVGRFDANGIKITHIHSSFSSPFVGAAAVRLLPQTK